MTENMAGKWQGWQGGREGLAGAIELLRDQYQAMLDGKFDGATYIGQVAGIGREAEIVIKLVIAELTAALEAAAAPAGTPSPFPLTKEQIERITARVQPQIEHEFIHGYTSATAQVLRVLTSLKIELDALATPSPQAPATTPVDEPKNDDRAYGCYTCGKQGLKKGQRVSLVYCNECDAKHIEEVRRAAATQEPAGCKLCEAEQPLDESGNYHDMGGHVRQKCMREPAGSALKPILPGVVWTPDGWDAAQASSEVREALAAIPGDVDTLISRAIYGETVEDVRRKVAGYLERALAPSRQGAGGK